MKATEQEYSAWITGYNAGFASGSSIENPAEWLIQALNGGGQSTSGQNVNYRSALTIAYVWAAQNIISGDVASLPFDVKRREPDDDLVLDRRHAAYWVLNGMSNQRTTAYLFREVMTHWALLLGNAMAYILRDSQGNPSQLIPAVPGDLWPRLVDGQLIYEFRRREGDRDIGIEPETFAARDVLHLRGLGDDLLGMSVLSQAKNSFGLALAQDKHGSEHFKNGGQPKIVLKHPRPLDKEKADALLERFEERHKENGRPALASGGLEIEKFPVNNTDAQWNESRKQAIVEVAAWFTLPPHKLGDDSRIAYNGIQAENQSYITQCLRRWLRRWETECTCKLLGMAEQRLFATVLRHDPAPLTDTDTGAVTAEVKAQRESMLITTNEGRRRLGYPRIEDGDRLLNPNTSSPDTPPEPDNAPDMEPEPEAVVDREPFVRLAAERLQRLGDSMTSHAKNWRKNGQEFDASWCAMWRERSGEYLGPSLDAADCCFSCTPLPEVADVVVGWAADAAQGSEFNPSAAELAEQIIGAPK